ncbi:MAG: hypothetical protein ONB05_05975 [candidate division KSB1 bacterium]|nr:hypothetical protein [candidate division KSB1 bacterium]
MLTRNTIKIQLLFLSVLSWYHLSNGASFYSNKGIGLLSYFTTGQGMGMGGIGIAIIDNISLNHLNPATLVPTPMTRLSGTFLYQTVSMKSPGEKGFSRYANANGLHFLMPLKRNISFSIGLTPVTLVDFEMRSEGEVSYRKQVRGNGGLNRVVLSLFYAPIEKIYLGFSFNYNFANIEETWVVDFYSDEFNDTQDVLSTRLWGPNFTTGLIFRLRKDWTMGVIYSTATQLRAKTSARYNFNEAPYNFAEESLAQYHQVNFPYAWGIGSAYTIKHKVLLGADFYTQAWHQFALDGKKLPGYHNSYRLSLGGQYTPSKDPLSSYFKRVCYRAGFFQETLYFEYQTRNKIKEYGATLGLGFPFYHDSGRIDLAAEIGKRGTLAQNPVEENFVNVFITITVGERWFQRR